MTKPRTVRCPSCNKTNARRLSSCWHCAQSFDHEPPTTHMGLLVQARPLHPHSRESFAGACA